MLIRAVKREEQAFYDQVVSHPLQSWSWGEFRQDTGVEIDRLGFYQDGKLDKGLQVTFHPIPLLNKTAGYLPKSFMPSEDQLSALEELGEQHNALFIKLEPNVSLPVNEPAEESGHRPIRKFLLDHGCQPGRPLFTKYTFELDLTISEDELFANLDSKTRYNTRLAKKKGVEIFENSTQEGLDIYLDILKKTTSRQGFYAHGPDYFQKMWNHLGKSGMMRIFNAVYQDAVLVSWIVFIFNEVLYYPYGASVREHREVMASNLMMWEIIRFGKKQGCKKFDMWGSLGPNPDKKNPWYGFHRFKKGYSGQLMEFIGTYDLVLNQSMYNLFRKADDLRWKFLRAKKKLGL
jgi:lipid II:glycine glycyltransferase (peptidoglycan interpeptide bridge formation enzyme)